MLIWSSIAAQDLRLFLRTCINFTQMLINLFLINMFYQIRKIGKYNYFICNIYFIYTYLYQLFFVKICICIFTIQKGKDILMFYLFRSPRLHLFDQKYSKNSNIVKYYYNL